MSTINQDIESVKKLLPEHYTVKESRTNGSIHCVSKTGIFKDIDAEDNEHWGRIMSGLREEFGDRFREVFHNTNFLHKDFTIYLKPENFPELTKEQSEHWEKFVCSHGLSMHPLDIDNFQFKGSRVKQLLQIATQEFYNDFNFYDNTLAMSFANPTGDPKAELKSDFALEGNSVYLINALIEQMEKHPEVAEVITNAAYNYLERNKV